MSDSGGAGRLVRATETTLAILEAVTRADGIRLTELPAELDVAESTVHRCLQTLLGAEYLVVGDREYHVGLRFLDGGRNARGRRKG